MNDFRTSGFSNLRRLARRCASRSLIPEWIYHVSDLRIEQVNRFDNQRIIQGMDLFQDTFFSGGKSAV